MIIHTLHYTWFYSSVNNMEKGRSRKKVRKTGINIKYILGQKVYRSFKSYTRTLVVSRVPMPFLHRLDMLLVMLARYSPPSYWYTTASRWHPAAPSCSCPSRTVSSVHSFSSSRHFQIVNRLDVGPWLNHSLTIIIFIIGQFHGHWLIFTKKSHLPCAIRSRPYIGYRFGVLNSAVLFSSD